MKLLSILLPSAFLLSSCATFDSRIEGSYTDASGNKYGGAYTLKNRAGYAK